MKPSSELFTTLPEHRAKVERLLASFGTDATGPVALSKKTSNLFRERERGAVGRLDVRALNRTLSVDAQAQTAETEGMTTFEDFADACLLHGCVPPVVPELKTITVGGAITGIGIESSSFRNGFVHETVMEMDVLCGDGVVRLCTATNEHADLFRAIPNSYGTLGYVLRAKLRVDRSRPIVALSHRRIADRKAFLDCLREACASGETDFVEGVVFAPGDHVVTTASFTAQAARPSDYKGMEIYHASLRRRATDFLTARDYLWRWDPDWFWCSRVFGMENPLLRRLLGRWMLRSSAYWKILTWYRKGKVEERVHALKRLLGRPIEFREPVIQDVEIPFEHADEFMEFYERFIDIRPCWVCPIVPGAAGRDWTLYPMEPGQLHLNFGFWESVPTTADLPSDHFNRLLEAEVVRLGGRKSLYSSVHFTEQEFWQVHDRTAYVALKDRYDPRRRFRDLYEKVVKGR